MKKRSDARRVWRLAGRRIFNAQHLTPNSQQSDLRKWLGVNGRPASSGFVRPFNSKNLFNRKSMIDNNGRGRTQMGPKTDSQAWGSPSLLKILNLSNRIRLNPSVQFFRVVGGGEYHQNGGSRLIAGKLLTLMTKLIHFPALPLAARHSVCRWRDCWATLPG